MNDNDVSRISESSPGTLPSAVGAFCGELDRGSSDLAVGGRTPDSEISDFAAAGRASNSEISDFPIWG